MGVVHYFGINVEWLGILGLDDWRVGHYIVMVMGLGR